MALSVAEFRSSDNVDLLLSVGFKISNTNVSSLDFNPGLPVDPNIDGPAVNPVGEAGVPGVGSRPDDSTTVTPSVAAPDGNKDQTLQKLGLQPNSEALLLPTHNLPPLVLSLSLLL
mgnify:CR=1 FL=1